MRKNTLQTLLLNWFDQHGRKHLPWQQNKTPYRVWISEVMLQQTQVTTVTPYFERFIERFPNVFQLANAHEDEVLHLWAGLGYYSRGRLIHKAAKYIAGCLMGELPDNLQELQKLPGIGPSTAGAILAIAFQKPQAILDGNVKRVLSRLHGTLEPVNDKKIETTLWELAAYFTPQKRTADYTQAIMDLGATVCTRHKPLCKTCPLKRHCIAFKKNLVDQIPNKIKPAAKPFRNSTFLIFLKRKQVFLVKRPSPGIWGGLWSFPELTDPPDHDKIKLFCQQAFHIQNFTSLLLPSLRHTFTHFHLNMYPVIIKAKRWPIKIKIPSQEIWYQLSKPRIIGLPKPVQTLLQKISDK